VINIHGSASNPIVKLTHRKPPMAEHEPAATPHDHESGRTSVYRSTDLLAKLLRLQARMKREEVRARASGQQSVAESGQSR
jgi:hypothetical protein